VGGHLLEHGPEIGETLRRQVERRVPRHQLLERHPNLLDLERLTVGDAPHPSAPVRLALDETFLLEPDEGGANGGAAGAEHPGQVRFDQALVGLEAPGDDSLSQAPVDVEAQLGSRRGPAKLAPCHRLDYR